MLKVAVPLVRVSHCRDALRLYCDGLGFRLAFANYADGEAADPAYLVLERDGVWLHLSSNSGDGQFGSAVNFFVDDVDALHAEFLSRSVPIALPPIDQTWGNREMYVKDADGNSIRFLCRPDD